MQIACFFLFRWSDIDSEQVMAQYDNSFQETP